MWFKKLGIVLTSIVLVFAILTLSDASGFDETQIKEMVDSHNRVRVEAGVTSRLAWSEKLANSAKDHAQKLREKKGCKPVHSGKKRVGENLYWASPLTFSSGRTELQKITAKRVAETWASEKADYHYPSNSCASGKVCGHYTQMIWENTAKFGCAKAVCTDNSQVWVCHYYPEGNYVGQKPY